MYKLHRIQIKPILVKLPSDIRWCLDFPRENDKLDVKSLTPLNIIFQGWVISSAGREIFPYIKSKDSIDILPLNMKRKDVFEKVLKKPPNKHPQPQCGFKYNLDVWEEIYTLGLIINNKQFDVAKVLIGPSIKVLKGKRGWLF